ncbi:hypothetical protein LINPERHAP1_LOCUS1515, partial [Linum perenne]
SSIIHASSIINQLSHIITAAAYNHSKKQIITAYKLHINHPNKTTTLQSSFIPTCFLFKELPRFFPPRPPRLLFSSI